jgi:hypothetical protein
MSQNGIKIVYLSMNLALQYLIKSRKIEHPVAFVSMHRCHDTAGLSKLQCFLHYYYYYYYVQRLFLLCYNILSKNYVRTVEIIF